MWTLSLVVLVLAAEPPARDAGTILREIRSLAESAQTERGGSGSEPLYLRVIASHARSLGQRIGRETVPQNYLRTLEENAELLRQVEGGGDSADAVAESLQWIATDMAIKRTRAARYPEAPFLARLAVSDSNVLRDPRDRLSVSGIPRRGTPRTFIPLGRDLPREIEVPAGVVELGIESAGNTVRLDVGADRKGRRAIDLSAEFATVSSDVAREATMTLLRNADNSVALIQRIEPHEWLAATRDSLVKLNAPRVSESMPPIYRRYLLDTQAFIASVGTDGKVTDEERRALQMACSDISSLAGRVAADRSWPKTIKVFVTTKGSTGEEVGNLEVVYVSPGLEGSQDPYAFGSFSSPTFADLVPVNWVLWARVPDDPEKEGARKRISLLQVQEDVVEIDVAAPR